MKLIACTNIPPPFCNLEEVSCYGMRIDGKCQLKWDNIDGCPEHPQTSSLVNFPAGKAAGNVKDYCQEECEICNGR